MLWQRARVVLGTLVTLQVHLPDDALSLDEAQVHHAIEAAFACMSHIGRVMSAHDPHSDLGRISQARPDSILRLDPHTLVVLSRAQHWHRVSGGAFNPCLAATHLSRAGRRPGLTLLPEPDANGWPFRMVSDTQLHVLHAVALDLGGIAKGYAVDQAVAVLRAQGVTSALVNAGGDLRAIGPRAWPVQTRHAQRSVRDATLRGVRQLVQGAVATSVAGLHNPEFVPTLPRMPHWQSATVRAPDCMTADVLTKWALQSSVLCPPLMRQLRQHGARMWRSR